ncbi:MAG TPA: ATP-binding protein [Polyangiaceae bacterium]|nr:ATP-binding protein [Polyangiaceae bacterium]
MRTFAWHEFMRREQRRLVLAASVHVAATIALGTLFSRVGSIVGICGLVAVVSSAFLFGLKGALVAAVAQLALNTTVMQLIIVPAVPIDGPSAVGILFFFVAGAVVGNQRDLSRKLRRELALNETLRVREKETLAAIPDAMIRIDSAGKCHLQPDPTSTKLVAALESVVRQPLPPEKIEDLDAAIAKARSSGEAQLLSLELPGHTFYDLRCLPAADASLLLVIRDMTELRRLLRRLTSAENLASLGTLAAGLAHEINNPLTYIITSLSSISRTSDACQSSVLAEVDRALDGCWRIRDLVRNILETTTSRRDEIDAVLVPEALEAALALVNPEVRHRATVKLELDESLYVEAHRTRLMQVVVNLLTNASQAFDDHRASTNQIVVRAFCDHEWVVVEVEDNGRGMDEATRQRAIEPFFTTQPVGQGSGLGLFLCSSIIESLGGSLQIESALGRGTKVTFKLRATEAAPSRSGIATHSTSRAPSLAPAPRLNILVIDDEPDIRRSLRRLLGVKHNIALATNGAEALRRFVQGERFDVILCDLLMPELTGIELFSELQQRFPEQSQRVVFLTGGATSEAARSFIEENRSRVLNKPFGPADIESKVSRFARVSPHHS